MRLEARICISPGPSWTNKVRLSVASIREFYPDTHFRVSVSPEGDVSDLPWEITGIDFHILDPAVFNVWETTRSPYLATVSDKYMPPFRGDYVLCLDADVICMREFDYLFERGERICGVQAHIPPIQAQDWARLFEMFGVHNFSLDQEYSGWGTMITDPSMRFGPTYFNSGVVFGPRSVFEKLHEPYFEAIAFMKKILSDTYWFDQLGLALGIAKAEIDASQLSLRYNFPNQAAFDQRHPHELADVRFLHYLRTDTIDRDRDLMSKDSMKALVARTDLAGSNEVFRKRVEQLLPRIA